MSEAYNEGYRLAYQSDESLAEAYIRSGSGALYRHYNIQGIQDILRGKIGNQGHIASLSDDEVAAIVQRIRDEKGMGSIKAHNLPGYEDA